MLGDPNSILFIGKSTRKRSEDDKESESAVNAGLGLLDFTDNMVEEGKSPDYRVVIVPLSKHLGYSLSRCETMFTCPYPSNESVREQMQGRIRRVDQTATMVSYYTMVAGHILKIFSERQQEAQSLSRALKLFTTRDA